jgi:hypothetical protein
LSILVPDRVLQTTTTVGTGAYTLDAPTGPFRAFNAVYGNGAVVPYCATDNQFGFEIGVGTLTLGTPNTIARATILLSSNANSAVNWTGMTKQIFAWDISGSAYVATFTGSKSVLLQDWGTSFVFTGASTGTFTLPALSTVPQGYCVKLKNSGTAACNATPHTGDQIENFGVSTAYSHSPGSSATYASDLSVWRQIDRIDVNAGITIHRVSSGSSDTLSALSAPRTQITWESSSGAAKSQGIPDPTAYDGYDLDIFDYFGDSGAHPITITPGGTGTITAAGLGSQATIGLASPYGNLSLRAIAALNTWIVR